MKIGEYQYHLVGIIWPCTPPVETRLTDLSKIGDDRPDIEALEIEKLFVYFFGHVLNTMFLNNKVMCNW